MEVMTGIRDQLLQAYGLEGQQISIEPFGSGLINHTWKLTGAKGDYILQRINTNVFRNPGTIAWNTRLIGDYLKQHYPGYLFVAAIEDVKGNNMVCLERGEYFRLFPFVPASRSIDVVENSEQAYEAAVQFGRFTRLLSGLEPASLKVTIPQFHDLSLRSSQFEQAAAHGNPDRIREAAGLIDTLSGLSFIEKKYRALRANPGFLQRIMHHDTKISNVLFDGRGKGLCVIDLDTVMPGYFISDVGDMMRTYLSPVSEEEKDFSRIVVRDDIYKAIVQGYYSEMRDEMTDEEQDCFFTPASS